MRESTARATLLVAEREVLALLRNKSYLISTAILLAAVLASIVVGAVLSGRDGEDPKVAVLPGVQVAGLEEGFTLVEVPDVEQARELVREGEVEAAVVPDGASPVEVRLIADDGEPEAVIEALTLEPEVELLNPSPHDESLRYLVSFGFGFVFLMSAMGFGSTIAQNTVQEKQSRIVELLLAAVPARALLAGKILGNSAMAFVQTGAVAAIAVLGLVVTGQQEVLTAVGTPLVWFVLFFVVGFVLLASIYAASASLVSRIEDVGSVLTPATMLTMAPYFAVVFFNDNPVAMKIMSYVPFSAPVGMPTRLFLGEASWWEPLVSLGILAAAAGLVVVLGAKIYERSLLRTGPRAKLREVLADR